MEKKMSNEVSKVKLEFKLPDKKVINYNGVNIEIIPLLTFAQQAVIANAYISEYFSSEPSVINKIENRIFEADYTLKNYVFQISTNLETESMDNNVYADTVLWGKITSEIVNYPDFKNKLDHFVYAINEQNTLKQSVGTILSDLVNRGYEIIQQFSDRNPEAIEKVVEETKSLIKKLEDSSILKDLPVTR